ncbi:MAG: hypothetical protein QXI16_05190 [Sulfolobaceae archaeon]
MFSDIFQVLYNMIYDLSASTIDELIVAVFSDITGASIHDINVNLVLFSETPIMSLSMYDLMVLFFTFFYSMFFIVLLYKVSKKVIKSLFGVLRW